jgi:serine/threonine protein kinase
MAPEIMLGKQKYDEKVDIWSVGTIFYELLVGKFNNNYFFIFF